VRVLKVGSSRSVAAKESFVQQAEAWQASAGGNRRIGTRTCSEDQQCSKTGPKPFCAPKGKTCCGTKVSKDDDQVCCGGTVCCEKDQSKNKRCKASND
jgi:hypothetical protein